MNRIRFHLAALALPLLLLPLGPSLAQEPPAASSALADHIEIPSTISLGKELLAKVATNEGDRVVWLADSGSTVVKIGDGRAHVFATPGPHKIIAIVVPPGDGEPAKLESAYTIEGGGPMPPVVVLTLAEKAGPLAPTFVEVLTDGREGLGVLNSVAQFQKFLDASFKMVNIPPDHPAAVEIKTRVDAAASGSLADAKVRQSLDAALAKMASELGEGPTPPPTPPVVEGKRLVVIVHEVDDASSAFANLKVNTANNSAAANYFRSNGHVVQFLEEEQKDQNGQPHPLVEKLKALGLGVPAIFVLDPATKAVLYQQKLEPGVTADNLVEYVKRGGG